MTNFNKIDFTNSVVFGTGYSVRNFFDSEKKIKKGTTSVCFQASFPNIIKEFSFFPDVWMWSDPHGALDGLRYIFESEKIKKNYNEKNKLTILIPEPLDSTYKQNREYSNYFGSSPVWRNMNLFYEYYGLLDLLKNQKNLNFKTFPTYTQKQMITKPEETKECTMANEEPEKRFSLSKPILGSFEYESDNSYLHIWGRENKVTSFVFPVMHYLGCKKLGVAGFDFGGSRFFNQNVMHPFQTGNFNDPIYKIVNIWVKKWQKYHKMDIYSLVEKGESGLNDILENA